MPQIFQNFNVFYRWFHYAKLYTITMAVFSTFLSPKGLLWMIVIRKETSGLQKGGGLAFPLDKQLSNFACPEQVLVDFFI